VLGFHHLSIRPASVNAIHSGRPALVKRSETNSMAQEAVMRMFDVQGIEITAPRHKVFEFLREPANLPHWAHAFVSAGNGRARLETPTGAVDVGLGITADEDSGVVDWRLAFPDGNVGLAQSRVTETTRGTCIYTFVLHAPPVALERVEGALAAQRALLRSELARLKSLMESDDDVRRSGRSCTAGGRR
jgi:polyketide cyclase/dehydrase/lipid transport protein